tara:strand:+ start:184 stop:336 length:153 start_codon:yes stop_codon:yes gene_type:complete
MNYEEMENQFMDWEIEHGKAEAIHIAAEEWGWSTYRVEKQVEKWENRLWQ